MDSKKTDEQKITKKNDREKMNILLDKLIPHLKRDKNFIESSLFSVANRGYVSSNLTNDIYKISGYGYLIIFLKKAETYYYNQGTKKINISKLRNDIDITKTNLRIAITKQDTNIQQKLCDKLIEQKRILDEALTHLTDVQQKNTPIDYVKAAIHIVKKNNERSVRFADMFRSRVSMQSHSYSQSYSQSNGDDFNTIVETVTVQIKKEEKKPSIFGKKILTLN